MPEGRKPLATKWVFVTKKDAAGNPTKRKARLVAKGFLQKPGVDFSEVYAPVVRPSSLRLLLSVVVRRKLLLRQFDVESAYLHGKLEEELYLQVPEGVTPPTVMTRPGLKLIKAIYGLKQAGRVWNKTLDVKLRSIGFEPTKLELCLYRNKDRTMFVSVYVDDLIVAATTIGGTDRVVGLIKEDFPLKELGEVRDLLGVRLSYDRERGNLKLSQPGLAKQIYNEARVGRFVSTPLEGGNTASVDDGEEIQNADQYRTLVGKAMYLATMTRPDLSFAVRYLAQSVASPTELDWKNLMHLCRYIGRTENAELNYNVSTVMSGVITYSDASYASEKGRTSVTGYATFHGGNLVSWGSKKQGVVAQSTCEAELIAGNEGGRDARWAHNLLQELGEKTQAPLLRVDNSGAIALVTTKGVESQDETPGDKVPTAPRPNSTGEPACRVLPYRSHAR
uniref:Reverse transcriptase Ty1/copia-type domain-containing protein n=1 Tax=Rhodosorus marinus TaxID=101924 RepID=A0A7S0BMV8_9RHOD